MQDQKNNEPMHNVRIPRSVYRAMELQALKDNPEGPRARVAHYLTGLHEAHVAALAHVESLGSLNREEQT